MRFDSLKIRTRLTLALAAMALLIALLGAIALGSLTAVHRAFTGVMEDRYPTVLIVNDLRAAHNESMQAVRNLFIMSDPDDMQSQRALIATTAQRVQTLIGQLKQKIDTDEGRKLLDQLARARTAYVKSREPMFELLKTGRDEEAKNLLLIDVRPHETAYVNKLNDLVTLENGLMEGEGTHATATTARARIIVIALLLTAAGVAFGMAVWVIRSITQPLQEAVRIARGVADGDLAMEFRSDGQTETGLLLGALHLMKTRLASIVGDVRANAQGVATASAEIAQGNSDLSSRTEQQASTLQQTTASMGQLSDAVRKNADNARLADQLARGASSVAQQGGEAVGDVVKTMQGISDSARKVSEIIGVIDGIAFQTNILALNAAVEAARAGEQGRGFAVVASEVRTLAQRSAQAAKEIKGLIGVSLERVEQGSAQVNAAGERMQDVVASIHRVTDIVAEISAASAEQSDGVTHVGSAVTQMDRATQQNAALVEQSAAAAESLKTQAEQLVASMAVFKLAEA